MHTKRKCSQLKQKMDGKRPKGLFFKNKMEKRTNVVFLSKDVNIYIRFFWESAFGVLLPRLGRKLTEFIKIETEPIAHCTDGPQINDHISSVGTTY